MKKLLVLLFLTTLLLTSCKKKFPDGPLISFRSIYTRIDGKWESENYIVNGIDSTDFLNNKLGAKCQLNILGGEGSDPGIGETIFQWGNDTSNYLYLHSFYEVALANTWMDLDFSQVYAIKNPPKLYIAMGDSDFRYFQVLKCKYETMWIGFQLHNKNYELHFNSLSKYE
jgi:hypothetical protein